MNKRTVEVIFGNSMYVSMMNSNLNKNIILLFNTQFSISDLSFVNDYKLNINMDLSDYLNNEYSFKEEIIKLDSYVKNGDKIRVWSSHKDIEPYLLLLYICNRYKYKNILLYVTFSENINNYDSPSYLKSEDLEKLSTIDYNISKEEILDYSKVWEDLVIKNSPMRVIENGNVLSVDLNYFDGLILNLLKEEGVSKIVRITALMLSIYHIQDLQVLYFIDRLIEKGKIRVVEKSLEKHFLDKIDIVI